MRFEARFTIAFALFAVASAYGALTFWPLAWVAVSSALVSAAYAGIGAGVFAKDDNGRLHPIAVLVLAPYLVVAWTVMFMLRLGSEGAHHEIRPKLFLGRRPLHVRELPLGTSLIVDLTAEFPGIRAKDAEYLCLATLDGSAPNDLARTRVVVERIRAHDGVAYVHCAAGHGRSAAIVAAILIVEGRVATVREAVELMRRQRPGVGLSRSQRALVRALISSEKTRT